ncbi:MAG: C39 family peptidase [Patescibacteria group bacterium]
MKNILLFSFLFFASLLGFHFLSQYFEESHQTGQEKGKLESEILNSEKNLPQANSAQEREKKEKRSEEDNDENKEEDERESANNPPKLPKQHLNKTPFVVQAPFGNWDELHEEACEEAALVMANAYIENIKNLSPEKSDQELTSLVKFAEENLNHKPDINTKQMVDLFKEYYNQEASVVENPTIEEIKKHLFEEGIVVAPAAGRSLENPHFQNPGPLYHALVIIGYDEVEKQFITNDPGTRQGEEFSYDYQNLMNSIHDFPESEKKEDILEGERRVLFIHKEPELTK